jgi:UDP-glucose 6-dehydrogenase
MAFFIIPIRSFINDLKKLSKKYPCLKDDINDIVSALKISPQTGKPLGKIALKYGGK